MPKLSWPHADQHFMLKRPGPLITSYLTRHAKANITLAFDELGPKFVYIQQRRDLQPAPQAWPHSQLGMAADNLQDMRLYTRMRDVEGSLPAAEREAAYQHLGFSPSSSSISRPCKPSSKGHAPTMRGRCCSSTRPFFLRSTLPPRQAWAS